MKSSNTRNFIFVLTFLFMLFGSHSVLANNHSDTYWSFNFNGFNSTNYTAARAKQDASSSYAKVNYVSNKTPVSCYIVNESKNSVNSQVVILNAGQWSYITQLAYEWNVRSVRLAVKNNSVLNINAQGVWSPDSI